jgi:Ca-activated chloride channel family protein
MSSAAAEPRRWFLRGRERSLLTILPSWVASLILHAALLALFASGFWIGDGGNSVGAGDGEYREIGLYSRQTNEAESSDAITASESVAETSFAADASLSQPPAVSEAAPAALSLPQTVESPAIGFGGPPLAGSPSEVTDLVRPSGVRAGSPSSSGQASFFGANDQGSRIVYVVDCSGSMTGDPVRVAKAELRASLAGLDETQQFQIIFYNTSPRVMTIRGDAQPKLYWATQINRTLAGQWIASVPADAGTNHVPALKRALAMKPEVLFFLTDADQPELSAKELNDIRALNGGNTRIHCIEFGKGPELNSENFLKKLARENGGTYAYRDVTKFRVR